jgi:hypothetical protein
VLDWSSLDLAATAPGHHVFSPGDHATELPYLDATIDVVAIADVARMDEARRVAASAAILVDREGAEIVPRHVELLEGDAQSAPQRVLAIVGGTPGPQWLERVGEALGDEPGLRVVGASSRPRRLKHELVITLDDGVLPLPGALAAARRTLAAHRADGVAVKLLAADGTLEAAGAMVLDDGAVAGVAAGADLHAPWHEFVRPVGAALGMRVQRAGARGKRLIYQPEACAVRAAGEQPTAPALRPWRELIAQGDVR